MELREVLDLYESKGYILEMHETKVEMMTHTKVFVFKDNEKKFDGLHKTYSSEKQPLASYLLTVFKVIENQLNKIENIEI